MSTCLRLNCAKTERKHPDPTAIQDSAVASQTLNLALKKEELCIAINLVINRKRTCLGRAERLGMRTSALVPKSRQLNTRSSNGQCPCS